MILKKTNGIFRDRIGWVLEGYAFTKGIVFQLKIVLFADFVILNALHNYFSFYCLKAKSRPTEMVSLLIVLQNCKLYAFRP